MAYRSKFEASVAHALTKGGVTFTYESIKIPYKLKVRCNPCSVCGNSTVTSSHVYIPDFVIGDITKPETCIFIEAKGKLDVKQRKKFEALKAQYPQYDIRFVFQRNNRIRPRSSTYYSDWANKLNYPYCISVVQRKWLKELKKC